MPHCVALLSGGLDSMLAIRILQEQGVRIDAVSFETVFTRCREPAVRAAAMLDVPLATVSCGDDYLDLIRQPRFGYGKGANPCLDCRIYMFRRARRVMERIGADFVISGEVLGQRTRSQKRRDLDAIAYHSGLEDLLLRPLSARLLPPTRGEREGWVDRGRLHAFSGRGRKGLIRLARRYGLTQIPEITNGCPLTEPQFARNVFDLIQLEPLASRWDFALLNVGRHFRHGDLCKVVVGRNQAENQALQRMHGDPDASRSLLLMPRNYRGAAALLVGPPTAEALDFAAGLLDRYGKTDGIDDPQVDVHQPDGVGQMSIRPQPAARRARTLAAS